MEQPHVIFLVADQLRYDMLGRGLTPNIDAIAAQSVQMEHAYCASPLCVPARGTLFTGTYPNTNGSIINPWCVQDRPHGNVHQWVDHLYHQMEAGGWDCIHSGKQHFFTEGGKLEHRQDSSTTWASTEQSYRAFLEADGVQIPGGEAFRSVVPEMAGGKHTRYMKYSNAHTGCYEGGLAHYFDGYFTDQAMQALKDRDATKPLFFSGMFLAPHPPLDVPDPYYSALKPEDVTLPENVGQWYDHQSPLQLYNLTGAVGTRYTLPEWKEAWRVYMGLVTLLDDCVGRIVEELKSQGIYDDCLIVFTTDHGEMLGSHQLFQKMCMYEESVRAPLYLRLPQSKHAGVCLEGNISHVDLFPTICDYLGITSNSAPDGVSLMQDIKDGTKVNRPVFIQFDGNGARGNFQRCIIFGEYKLIVDIFKDEVHYELYDITRDVQETTNLLFVQDAPLVIAEHLLAQLAQHMQSTGDLIILPEISLQEFMDAHAPFLPKR